MLLLVHSRRDVDENITAYTHAPKMYSTPCKTSHERPICFLICTVPYSHRPCRTGKIADSPIDTNIAALKGLQAGVRNFDSTDTAVQPAPREHIYSTSDIAG